MNHWIEFWNNLGDDKFFFWLLLIVLISHLSFMLYRWWLLKKGKTKEDKATDEGVSVIITCSNKCELLEENLAAFLEQDYPNFEVIVVDECSEDDTKDILAKFQEKYPNLKTSRISPATKFRRTKKLAINIGVLAAKYDILLYSEITCRPANRNWIASMQSAFQPDTSVVLGYANYENAPSSRIRRYFRFIHFWQTTLLIRSGFYIIGNAFNMAFRKKCYLAERGYTRNTQEYIGFDSDLVKGLSQKGKVRIVKDENSFVNIVENSDRTWKDDTSYYYASMMRWPLKAGIFGNADFFLEILLYLLLLHFIVLNEFRLYFMILTVVVSIYDLIFVNLTFRHLSQKDLFLPSLCCNVFGFIYKSYYFICSFLSKNKWK